MIFKTLPEIPPFVAPINTENIKYPSDHAKLWFLKNFQDARKTQDLTKRYLLLEENFSALLGFYVASHDPALRAQAEKYATYMAKNYPQQYQKNKRLYTVTCMDTECGKANYPKEVEEIKQDLGGISSLNKGVLDNILKNFEAAAISNDKNSQFTNYLDSFSELKSEYTLAKDAKIKDVAEKLKAFMEKSYPDEFKAFAKSMPKLLTLEQ